MVFWVDRAQQGSSSAPHVIGWFSRNLGGWWDCNTQDGSLRSLAVDVCFHLEIQTRMSAGQLWSRTNMKTGLLEHGYWVPRSCIQAAKDKADNILRSRLGSYIALILPHSIGSCQSLGYYRPTAERITQGINARQCKSLGSIIVNFMCVCSCVQL